MKNLNQKFRDPAALMSCCILFCLSCLLASVFLLGVDILGVASVDLLTAFSPVLACFAICAAGATVWLFCLAARFLYLVVRECVRLMRDKNLPNK